MNHTEHHTNEKCLSCEKAINCINGRYCHELNCYVEYAKVPLCKENNQNKQAI